MTDSQEGTAGEGSSSAGDNDACTEAHHEEHHGVAGRLRTKLTVLEKELQTYEEGLLRTRALEKRVSVGPKAASSVSLLLDFDTTKVNPRILAPEGSAEFFLAKLLAAGIPVTLLASGMDLEVLSHVNPNLLSVLENNKLAALVSVPWARARPSLYPELFHLNVLTDKITRTEVGIAKSRALFIPQSDLFPALIPFVSAAEYTLLVLDREAVSLTAVHPFQSDPTCELDTCVVTAAGVPTATVKALVANSRGGVQKQWESAVLGGDAEAEALADRLRRVAARPPGAAAKEGGGAGEAAAAAAAADAYGAVVIDFLSVLDTPEAAARHSETSLGIAQALLELQRSQEVEFKGLGEEAVKHICASTQVSDQNLYLASTPPMCVSDPFLPAVKVHSHRVAEFPEYHQRLLLFASSVAPAADREVALLCLQLIPERVPEDGAETLNSILHIDKAEELERRRKAEAEERDRYRALRELIHGKDYRPAYNPDEGQEEACGGARSGGAGRGGGSGANGSGSGGGGGEGELPGGATLEDLWLSLLLHTILSQYSTTVVNSRSAAHFQDMLRA